jgi:PIN domain nuclease of toxin-antitoxin system
LDHVDVPAAGPNFKTYSCSGLLDSFAVLAFLSGEPGYEKVLTVLEKAAETDSNLMIAAPNWAEVRYTVERKVGLSEWLRVRARLLGLPLNIVPADQELSELASELKLMKRCLGRIVLRRTGEAGKAEIYTKTVEREIKVVWL